MIQFLMLGAQAFGGSTIQSLAANVFASALSGGSAGGADKAKSLRDYTDKAKKAALRIVSARTRRRIIDIYAGNEFNWDKRVDYSNWLGLGMSVSVGGLATANRPIKTMTRGGKRRKRGYSMRAINPPKQYPLGGRLPKGTRYKVTDDNAQIGILDNSQTKVKNKMSRFQDGGSVTDTNAESRRKYFAALGVFYRRNTILRAEPRPLYEPLQQKYPLAEAYQKAFDELMNDKLRMGD